MRRLPLLLLLAVAGCAHTDSAKGPEGLRKAAEQFFRAIRWHDYLGAADSLTPDRRAAFTAARVRNHDRRDLSIADYDLEQIQIAPDEMNGQVVAHMSWIRLPSVTLKTEDVVGAFVFRDGHWLLTKLDGGPFAELR